MQLELGQNYSYNQVTEFANTNQFPIESLGEEQVGQNILQIQDFDQEKTYNFVLDSTTSRNGYSYKLVYCG